MYYRRYCWLMNKRKAVFIVARAESHISAREPLPEPIFGAVFLGSIEAGCFVLSLLCVKCKKSINSFSPSGL